MVNNPTLNRNIGKLNIDHIWDRILLIPLTLKQPFLKGMCTYAHSYYISCSYVGLSSDLKRSTVADESLSVSINPMFCYENTFNYSIVIHLFISPKHWHVTYVHLHALSLTNTTCLWLSHITCMVLFNAYLMSIICYRQFCETTIHRWCQYRGWFCETTRDGLL